MGEPDAAAYEAAERLVRDAHARAEEAAADAEAAAAGAGVPRSGWDTPRAERPAASPFPDLSALVALLDMARGTIPPELARPLADALRELLIALRAIIDYSIDRLEPADQHERRVEDIPIQ
jgi:hypothetical protein